MPDRSPIWEDSHRGLYVTRVGARGGSARRRSGQVFAHTIARDEPHPINAPFTLERFTTGRLIDEAAAAAAAHGGSAMLLIRCPIASRICPSLDSPMRASPTSLAAGPVAGQRRGMARLLFIRSNLCAASISSAGATSTVAPASSTRRRPSPTVSSRLTRRGRAPSRYLRSGREAPNDPTSSNWPRPRRSPQALSASASTARAIRASPAIPSPRRCRQRCPPDGPLLQISPAPRRGLGRFDEPNALMVPSRGPGRFEPNTRATIQELRDCLEATSQNRWPSRLRRRVHQ